MDKLIANASVGLAKAGMNRRGFLGRLARAAGGAAVLTAAFAKAAYADHCWGPYICNQSSWYQLGCCGGHGCSHRQKPKFHIVEGEHCVSGERCRQVTFVGCVNTECPSPCG